MFVSVWGEFGLMVEDVMNLTVVPLHEEANTMGMAFKKENEKKL